MEFDIFKRIVRIIIVTIFLLVCSFMRNDMEHSYVNAKSFDDLGFFELSDGISLTDAYPVKDEVGMEYNGYRFGIVNNSDIDRNYKISLIKDNSSTLDYSCIRYQLIKNGEVVVYADMISSDGILYIDNISSKNSDIYEIKFWINYYAGNEILGKHFLTKIAIL